MQNTHTFSQQNNYVVNPVYIKKLGLFADGKMLYCENCKYVL